MSHAYNGAPTPGQAAGPLSASNDVLHRLAAENPNMTDYERLVNLYWALTSVLRSDVPGDVVELGCNAGLTSVLLAMVIEAEDPSRTLHLYDSFKGLPSPSVHDAYLKEGDCAAEVSDVYRTFERWQVRRPEVHPGWFQETLPTQLPKTVAFGYLDGDFYESILTSLTDVWPRLPYGGTLIVDDYCDPAANPRAWNGLPGVKKACDDFFMSRPVKMRVLTGCGDLAFVELRKA
jgi:O-methyltransferase